MKVAVGMIDSTSVANNRYISVRDWINHPDWKKGHGQGRFFQGPEPPDFDKDFAIIKLAEHVPFKNPKDAAPACLPKSSKSYDDVSATVREAFMRKKKMNGYLTWKHGK